VTREVIGKSGIKTLGKAVRISVENGICRVAMAVNIQFGCNVPDTCAKVQDRVKTAVETMTGLEVSEVDIRVASVVMENAGKKTTSRKDAKKTADK